MKSFWPDLCIIFCRFSSDEMNCRNMIAPEDVQNVPSILTSTKLGETLILELVTTMTHATANMVLLQWNVILVQSSSENGVWRPTTAQCGTCRCSAL